MAISEKLFMAILSMDSYNRGYGAGIEELGATCNCNSDQRYRKLVFLR